VDQLGPVLVAWQTNSADLGEQVVGPTARLTPSASASSRLLSGCRQSGGASERHLPDDTMVVAEPLLTHRRLPTTIPPGQRQKHPPDLVKDYVAFLPPQGARSTPLKLRSPPCRPGRSTPWPVTNTNLSLTRVPCPRPSRPAWPRTTAKAEANVTARRLNGPLTEQCQRSVRLL